MKLFSKSGYQHIKQPLDVICLNQVEVVFVLVLFMLFLQTYLKFLANSLFWEPKQGSRYYSSPAESIFNINYLAVC